MGRIRTIKPDLPEDEQLGAVSREARLTFVLLFTVADDEGRFRAAPALIRSQLFPYDADVLIGDIRRWLDELLDSGRIRLYQVEGQWYGDIPRWKRHQRIDKPQTSKLPTFDDGSPIDLLLPADDSRTDKEEEGKGSGSISVAKATSSVSPEVIEVWETWLASTGRTRCKLDPKRRGIIGRAIKSHGLDDVLDAVRGWVNDPWLERAQRNDLRYLIGDADRIENFRDLWRAGPPKSEEERREERIRRELLGAAS